MNKDYAALLHALLADKQMVLDKKEAINANEEIGQAVEEMLEELRENEYDPLELHYVALVDFLMEGKSQDEFAEYIRNHAEVLAQSCTHKALRKLCYPKYLRRIKELIVQNDAEKNKA